MLRVLCCVTLHTTYNTVWIFERSVVLCCVKIHTTQHPSHNISLCPVVWRFTQHNTLHTTYRSPTNMWCGMLLLLLLWVLCCANAHTTHRSHACMWCGMLLLLWESRCVNVRTTYHSHTYMCYSQLQIGWHRISRVFLKLFKRTRILPMGFTIGNQ